MDLIILYFGALFGGIVGAYVKHYQDQRKNNDRRTNK